MPVIVVEDDKVLRALHVLLDPEAPAVRIAAFTDYLAFDLDDVSALQEDKDALLNKILTFSKVSKEEAEKLRPLSPTPEP